MHIHALMGRLSNPLHVKLQPAATGFESMHELNRISSEIQLNLCLARTWRK